MKILYVEDNEDNIYMLKNEQPDLILMDLTLPDINGEEATRRLKADPATKSIPVIALTANAMASDRERAIAAGCDEFETKPVDMPRLLGKIAAFNGHS
jgi:two-component system cell cycle response regulator DivK